MANQYKNKVVYNGATLIDLTDTTAVQSDVASGKYFYTASGQRVQGTGQGGSSGYTRTVIVPEQTVTPVYHSDGNVNGYSAQLNNTTEMFEQWSEYIVTFNGTEYYFTTILMWSNNYLMGEQAYLWRGTSETVYPYPFCVIATSINDNYIYTASTDSVTVKIEKIELTGSGGGSVTWETMADQTCTITTYDGMRIVTINGYNEPLSANETYRITWGETQYVCNTIADPVGFTQDGYYMGNSRVFGSQYEDTGEPFVFYRTSSTRLTGATEDTASSVYVKIEKQVPASSGGITPTGTVSITTNGTHDVTNYASASVSVTPNLQSKSATPTTSSQTVSPDNGYDGLSSVTIGAIPSQYIVPTGNKAITANGNNIDVAEYATVSVSVSGSSKNVQTAQSTARATSSTYTNLISLTCSTAGKYDIYWDCFRSTTGGTTGSQLYINGTGQGTANTAFTNHVQTNHLTNITLAEDDVVAVYARSRGNNYYAYVGTLTIVQTA